MTPAVQNAAECVLKVARQRNLLGYALLSPNDAGERRCH